MKWILIIALALIGVAGAISPESINWSQQITSDVNMGDYDLTVGSLNGTDISELGGGGANQTLDSVTILPKSGKILAVDAGGEIISSANAGTNDTSFINSVIVSIRSNPFHLVVKDLSIAQGTPLVIENTDNSTIDFYNTSFKANSTYAGYYSSGYKQALFADNERLTVNGLVLNGNHNEYAPSSFNALTVESGNDTIFDHLLIRDVQFGLANSANHTVVRSSLLLNVGSEAGNTEAVYGTGSGNASGAFDGCSIINERAFAGNIQAFYMNVGTYTYRNIYFKNVGICYDLRNGKHTIIGGHAENVTNAIIVGGAGGDADVYMIGASFVDVWGHTGGAYNAAAYARGGHASFIQTSIAAKSGAPSAYYGMLLYQSNNARVEDCRITGFNDGIDIDGTIGLNQINGNNITNCYYGVASGHFVANTGKSVAENNIFSGNTADYYNNDGMLTIQGIGYENSGTSSILSGNSSKAVAHGLVITPDAGSIDIRKKEDFHGHDVWVSATNATYFVVTLNGTAPEDLDFGWKISS